MTDLLPKAFPLAIVAGIVGRDKRTFKRLVIDTGRVTLDARGHITRASLESYLGYPISADRYLAACRRLEPARRYQRAYWHQHKELDHAVMA